MSTYENEIFNKIKYNNDEIISLKNKIYLMQINNLINKDLSSSKNLFDLQDNNKNYFVDFSYIDKSSTNNDENNFQISLTCSSVNCGNKVKYLCNEHCYKYFCDSCKNKFDNDFCSHQFAEIDENKENEKIKFINSFSQLYKIYLNKVDRITKANTEEIKYPILKSFNETDLQQFLSEIFHHPILNDNIDCGFAKSQICAPILISIKRLFKLDIPTVDLIDDNFLEDESYLIGEKLKIKIKESNYFSNKLYNKIKSIIKNELSSHMKKIEKNLSFLNKNNPLNNNLNSIVKPFSFNEYMNSINNNININHMMMNNNLNNNYMMMNNNMNNNTFSSNIHNNNHDFDFYK